MIENNQQTKSYETREGFPLSSKQFNDLFDAVVTDVITIMSLPLPSLSDLFADTIDAISLAEALGTRNPYKKLDIVIKDHTENWRTL